MRPVAAPPSEARPLLLSHSGAGAASGSSSAPRSLELDPGREPLDLRHAEFAGDSSPLLSREGPGDAEGDAPSPSLRQFVADMGYVLGVLRCARGSLASNPLRRDTLRTSFRN